MNNITYESVLEDYRRLYKKESPTKEEYERVNKKARVVISSGDELFDSMKLEALNRASSHVRTKVVNYTRYKVLESERSHQKRVREALLSVPCKRVEHTATGVYVDGVKV